MPPDSSADFDVHLERSLRDLKDLREDLSCDVLCFTTREMSQMQTRNTRKLVRGKFTWISKKENTNGRKRDILLEIVISPAENVSMGLVLGPSCWVHFKRRDNCTVIL